MANTVLLKDLVDVLVIRITIYSSKERAITVEYQGKLYKFKNFQYGLYYYDTAVLKYISSKPDKYNSPITNSLFLRTVEYNKSYFSSNKIEGANNARKVQQIIGWPSTDNFKYIIKKTTH